MLSPLDIISIDQETSSFLKSGLDRATSGGNNEPVDSELLWLEDIMPSDGSYSSSSTTPYNEEVMSEVTLKLQQKKKAQDVLHILSQSVKLAKDELMRRVQPSIMHHGLNALPTELLIRIVELAYRSQQITSENAFRARPNFFRGSINPELTIGSVCRRFREVTLMTPSLWTHIRFVRSLDWVKLQLERSGTAPLFIEFDDYTFDPEACEKEGRCVAYATAVLRHHPRWERVIFTCFHDGAKMNNLLRNWSFRMLRELTISDDGQYWDGRPLTEFINTWSATRLQRLVCDYTALKCQLLERLKTFEFRSNRRVLAGLYELAVFLGHPTAGELQELSLEFSLLSRSLTREQATFPDTPLPACARQVNPDIQLDRLRTLNITIGEGIENADLIIYLLLKRLSTPNICNIYFSFNINSGIVACLDWLDWMTMRSHTFPKLRGLRFVLHLDRTFEVEEDLEYVRGCMERLESRLTEAPTKPTITAIYVDPDEKVFVSNLQGTEVSIRHAVQQIYYYYHYFVVLIFMGLFIYSPILVGFSYS